MMRVKYVKGQAMTEFIIVIPVLILLIFGTIQIAFIYSAKLTLNYATFQAARLAAVNHASYSAMRRGLIRGLAPMYTLSDDTEDVGDDIWDGASSDDGMRDAQSEVDEYTRIIRLSPSAAVFSSGMGGYGVINNEGILAIPNDNLMYRDDSVSSSGVSIQDANLLKIRVQYCYKLMVPIVNRIIGSLSELNNTRALSEYHKDVTPGDPRWADRNRGAVDEASNLAASMASYDELCRGRGSENRSDNNTGFVIMAEAIVRMQSAAWAEDVNKEYEGMMCNGDQMACP